MKQIKTQNKSVITCIYVYKYVCILDVFLFKCDVMMCVRVCVSACFCKFENCDLDAML